MNSKSKFRRRKTSRIKSLIIVEENPDDLSADLLKEIGEYDPKLDLSDYTLPPIDLLKDYGGGSLSVDKEELEGNKDRIVETLANYKIAISKIKQRLVQQLLCMNWFLLQEYVFLKSKILKMTSLLV